MTDTFNEMGGKSGTTKKKPEEVEQENSYSGWWEEL